MGATLPGISDDPMFGMGVVEVNRKYNRGLPRHYVLFTDDGGDYTFYLDTSKMNEKGESPVVIFGPGEDGTTVATTFLEFLRKISAGEAP